MAAIQPWLNAYSARFDNSSYGSDALGLFALGLRFGIDDLDNLASDVITGGGDDKKCDIIYVNREEQRIVVAQCYASEKEKKEAPANKASDLNAAISWLIAAPISTLPAQLQPYAEEVRDAISSGDIREVFIWYVHNLKESKNVEKELKTVETSAVTQIRALNKDDHIRVSAAEIGQTAFQTWYEESQSPILITEKFAVPVKEAFKVSGGGWRAVVAYVPGIFFYNLYKKHGTKLFSANIRDYLGSRASDSNINFAIKGTAELSPGNFWAFNNGITAIVNKAQIRTTGDKRRVEFRGISIVNGAQTTGALGSLEKPPSQKLFVPARFIETSSSDLVDDIIRFNNSQNRISAADFRSTDGIQKRLKIEFSELRDVEYDGGRRGGSTDAIRRRPNLLPSLAVGQALAAFHGDPETAYNRKAKIWTNDTLYARYFHEKTTAAHVLFVYSLLRKINIIKTELKAKLKNDPQSLTDIEKAQLDFFEKKGSTFLLVAAVSACLETILGRSVPDKFSVHFRKKSNLRDAEENWSKIISIVLPLSVHLSDGFSGKRITAEGVPKAINQFRTLFAAVAAPNKRALSEFAQLTNA
jgi:hypothetical protein